jgi:hypothetical protein
MKYKKIDMILTALCIIGIILVLMFGHGCALNCNTVMGHDSIWKSPAHAYFSIIGWKYMTPEDIRKSKEEGWWGCGVLKVSAAPDCGCN